MLWSAIVQLEYWNFSIRHKIFSISLSHKDDPISRPRTRINHDSWHCAEWNIPKGCAKDFIKDTASHETSRKYISLSAPHYSVLSSRYLVSATWDPVRPLCPFLKHPRASTLGKKRPSTWLKSHSGRVLPPEETVFIRGLPFSDSPAPSILSHNCRSSSYWPSCSRDWCMNSGLSITKCLSARRYEKSLRNDYRFLSARERERHWAWYNLLNCNKIKYNIYIYNIFIIKKIN